MIRRRKILDVLSRSRLLELTKEFGIAGLTGKSKDEIAAAIADTRSIKTPDLLAALSRDELKAVCREAGYDDSGREKSALIARLLGEATADAERPAPAAQPEFQLSGEPGTPATRRRRPRPAAETAPSPAPASGKRAIEQYEHEDKTRANNPPVGLVTPKTDPDTGQTRKKYQYDPHLDPQLVWAGKAEHTSFEVPTVSLHVHERIDPLSIIAAVRKRNGDHAAGRKVQQSLFEEPDENPPLREAVDFYKHPHGWTNRLIAGDSLLVMNSLLEKEGMAGKVQMVYIDPPYGIRYGSNFQPFVNRRDVKDGKDEDLTQEPEMIRAFRDTWELGIHSYLTYLRDRLLLARELLHESGSCFVQISDENLHHVRELMDEVFGAGNLAGIIAVRKTAAVSSPTAMTKVLATTCDYLVWYAKDHARVKYHQLYTAKLSGDAGAGVYQWIEHADGTRRRMRPSEMQNPMSIPEGARIFRLDNLTSTGWSDKLSAPIEFDGRVYSLGPNLHWKTTPDGMNALIQLRRAVPSGRSLAYVRYYDDFPVSPISDVWLDTGTGSFTEAKVYVVQTNAKVLQRCILMTTDPGDLVFDPTCGSGTTAVLAEHWGRRWATCDTSRVAVSLAKQRLMTTSFDFFEFARDDEGVGGGFQYVTVPHVTLRSIANNLRPVDEMLYDQPLVDKSKVRVTGPFTVEAVPAPAVQSIDRIAFETRDVTADKQGSLPEIGPLDGQERLGFQEEVAVVRSGETLRQSEWRDELLKCGIRGRSGQRVEFSRLEPLGGTRWLQCAGETKGERIDRLVVSFGPEHAPLEQRQVEQALEEATRLKPAPSMVVFASFQFDPEAAKDIDETIWPGVTLLKVQMNTDLLTEDLKKKRSSNESYWLIGQPDVELRPIAQGEQAGQWQVEVRGFDYYNPRSGQIESGDTAKIAMWLLDTDYDGRSLYPRQVFFPMSGEKDGWARLAKNLKAEIDEELIESYRGTVSLPFAPGNHARVAVKIVDDRGIESLRILEIQG